MARGGKREDAGRKLNSGKFKVKTKSARLPEHLTDLELRQAIVDVDLHLQKVNRDFIWLAKTINSFLDLSHDREAKVVRFSRQNQKDIPSSALYRKSAIPVAATFAQTPLSSDFDESAYEEIDLLQEFGDPSRTVLLAVRGESMIDVGIEPGDELVVEVIDYPMRVPNYGDLVIALLNGEVTVKEFQEVNNRSFLVPHNKELDRIEITRDDNFHIYGIVRKMIRTFKKRNFWL